MEFWETLWASLWGALAGAVVGSVAAWVFALDLRRRQSRADYDDKLNAAIGALSSAVRLVARTKRPSPWKRLRTFSRNRTIVDEEIVINATEAAMVVANSDDIEVLRMFEARMDLYFKGLTWQGRVDQLYAAMRTRGLATEEQIRAWARTAPPLRLAFSFWSSWEKTPLQSVSVLLSWRRGDITRAGAIRRLDPVVFPVYDLDSGDSVEDWSGVLRYGHWAPKAIRAQYREQERAASHAARVN